MASIRFVWILPPLEVDPVRKDGVGVEDKVDVVVGIGLRGATDSRSRPESRRQVRIFVVKFVCAGKIATDTTGIAVSFSEAICAPCSTESRGAA